MEKKAYISPTLISVALNVTSHLMDASRGPIVDSSQKAINDGDIDTKGSSDWGDIWSNDD